MKRILLLICVFVGLVASVSACQCSNKPDIGPVEEASIQVEGPVASGWWLVA